MGNGALYIKDEEKRCINCKLWKIICSTNYIKFVNCKDNNYQEFELKDKDEVIC